MATNMATNMAGVMNVSAAENTVPTEDPNLVTEAQVVNEEQINQEQLYIDFASDTPPVTSQTGVPAGGDQSSSNLAKRIDPRQEWINTDKTKPYFCKLCDYNMDCMEHFQHHCMCARHIKRAIEEFNIKLPKRLEEKEEKKPLPQYNCQVCLVTCNSDTAWNSHLIGQKHRKALEKQGAEIAQQKAQKNMVNSTSTGFGRGGRGAGGRGGGGVGPMRGGGYGPGHSRKPYDKPVHAVQQPSPSGPIGAKDFATYPEPLIGLEYVTEIQVIGQSPRYHCELCDSKFDHNLKFPHLVGSKHRFNVLKEKVPEVAQGIRGDVKKRSELSSKLLDEARKLEMMVGRQQVKTRMEKSPFNLINNQAAGQAMKPQTARGGGQQWQSQRGRGQGGARGGRGGSYGGATQGSTYGAGARGGTYNAGAQGGTRGRGRQQTTPFNHQQQSGSNRGGRGRGRGRGAAGNSQNQSWGQNYSSYNSAQNQTFSAGSYSGGDDNSQWHSGSQGQQDRMLPTEAFKPRSPPRQSQYSNYQDNYYDDYYGGNQQTAGDYSGSSYEYNNPYSSQNTNEQRFHPNDQIPSASGGGMSFDSDSMSTGASSVGGGGGGAAGAGGSGGAVRGGAGAGGSSVSLLQGAIADLGKLVSSEEDASMALQVSNALTQALLQFRMNNLPQESLGDNSAAAGSATSMKSQT
ncbi:hypothetical protein ACROYT_G024475 [Oculina patagonica]